MIKYFHELTEEELTALEIKNPSWDIINNLYPPPTWCGHPSPLDGIGTCWSLVQGKVNKEFCKTCELYKKEGGVIEK